MASVGRHDRDQAGAGDHGHAVDGDLELALDHLIDFFLGMEVLVNGRAAREVVGGERYVRRMEKATVPAGQALDNLETADVDKGHGCRILTHDEHGVRRITSHERGAVALWRAAVALAGGASPPVGAASALMRGAVPLVRGAIAL